MQNGADMDFGFGGIWGIIMLLIIAGLFGGNGFGWGNSRTNDISNEFLFNQLANDVRANGIAINTTDRDVLMSSCNTDKEVLQNRYDMSLQTNQLQNQASINALNMQNQLASCCCELKSAIHSEGEETRALITQNRINELEYSLTQANNAVANAVQTQNILNNLGNYYPKSGVNPYSVYGGYSSCGCGNTTII